MSQLKRTAPDTDTAQPAAKKPQTEPPSTISQPSPSSTLNGHGKQISTLKCLSGFGGHFESEALPHALPVGQNNPQKCPYGLYAEQLSGTSFTTPRVKNQRTWLYRIRPTVGQFPYKAVDTTVAEPMASAHMIGDFTRADAGSGVHISPDQFRWSAFPLPENNLSVDFLQGFHTVAGSGSPDLKAGLALHVYTCNVSMKDKGLLNSDGDLLIVPQLGTITIRTEMGVLRVPPRSIAVIPRGIVFGVELDEEHVAVRGYMCEVFNGHFMLPDLGPIGANGLANPRDFLYPTAQFEDRKCSFTVIQKFLGKWFSYVRAASPYDVVAWHGNYAPFMYDLDRFVPAGAVAVDHMDPSIFTVLTVQTTEPGVAAADFVVFPPRWAVQEHTFRPPYYHRNTMSEFMGNICGKYEAKPDGFVPGGASLHSCMSGHGPDAATFNKASSETLHPERLPDDSLAFMFESTFLLRLTDYSMKIHAPDPNYHAVWAGVETSHFDPNWKPEQN